MTRGTIMPSVDLAADLALLGSDTATIRPANPIERRRIGARWRAVAYAIVLRTCAGVDVVVADATKANGRLKPRQIGVLLETFGQEHGISRSAAVICVALRLFPSLEPLLATHRPSTGLCHTCVCIWHPGGPLDRGAAEHGMVQCLAAANQPERIAA